MTDQVLERFWDKVQVDPITSCWNWIGAKIRGYGEFFLNNKVIKAHRFAYEVNKGKIPDGMQIDHLCRNPSCVNPDHLEAVTQKENILRGDSIMAKKAKQIHCKRGHPLSGSNLYSNRNTGRACKLCQIQRNKSR